MSVTFEVRNRLVKGYNPKSLNIQWVSVTRHGQKWQDAMSGETFELFKIAVFSEAIDRSTEAIRDWERLGVIPRPLFSPQGEHCKRWYSVAQVINCHRIMRYRYGGRKYFQNHDLWEQFINDIKKVWFARNIIVGVDGKIMGVDG